MKINKDFILYDAGDETMLVPGGRAKFSGVVKGNDTLGAILRLLSEETTEQEVIRAMCDEYDAPEEIIARDVRSAIAALREIGALHD